MGSAACGSACLCPSQASQRGLRSAQLIQPRAGSTPGRGPSAGRARAARLWRCCGWKHLGSGLVPGYLLVARSRCTARASQGRAAGAALWRTAPVGGCVYLSLGGICVERRPLLVSSELQNQSHVFHRSVGVRTLQAGWGRAAAQGAPGGRCPARVPLQGGHRIRLQCGASGPCTPLVG